MGVSTIRVGRIGNSISVSPYSPSHSCTIVAFADQAVAGHADRNLGAGSLSFEIGPGLDFGAVGAV